ncbi:uncharacterized protein EI90DRAFT_2428267 [Cantharellus anzutake]|uniref:uncharacterized protein n=1 Tax=Cantharellus anzutake TaxID=1750568 RepID=UPI001904C6BD|nr:uncharacterized protein EI90DRAFT_2428267 [Cantharellus anzutake]KAF8338906.1 hypothetical protein EI90DRAFT_2428267 [Cantharellus anzutake]
MEVQGCGIKSPPRVIMFQVSQPTDKRHSSGQQAPGGLSLAIFVTPHRCELSRSFYSAAGMPERSLHPMAEHGLLDQNKLGRVVDCIGLPTDVYTTSLELLISVQGLDQHCDTYPNAAGFDCCLSTTPPPTLTPESSCFFPSRHFAAADLQHSKTSNPL